MTEAKAPDAPGDFDARGFLQQLTTQPGVYRMLGATGDLLYVGKARNLKKRVSQYFCGPRVIRASNRWCRRFATSTSR